MQTDTCAVPPIQAPRKIPSLGTACAALALAAVAAPAARAQTFSDATFNLADYAVQTYTQAGTITVSQTTAGHPGTALQMVIDIPSTAAVDRSAGYFINRNFVYDPAVRGALGSVSYSIEKSVVLLPSDLGWGNGQGFILEQAGRLFEVDAALAAVPGVFQLATVFSAPASSFFWLSNPALRVADATVHPDFAGAPMRFGFYNGIGTPAGWPTAQARYVFDNFSVTAVPEPATTALWLAGLAWSWARWRQGGRRFAPSLNSTRFFAGEPA